MALSILGVYLIEDSPEPCFFVEAIILDYSGSFDFGEITQEEVGEPARNWQVPFEVFLLDDTGTRGKEASFPGPVQIRGSGRIAFKIYFLNTDKPLIAPFGPVLLPSQESRPERLQFIQ